MYYFSLYRLRRCLSIACAKAGDLDGFCKNKKAGRPVLLAARLDGSVCVVAGGLLFAEDLAHAGGVKFFLGGLIDEGNGDVDGFFFCAGVSW